LGALRDGERLGLRVVRVDIGMAKFFSFSQSLTAIDDDDDDDDEPLHSRVDINLVYRHQLSFT
jgi:hypothetical protein